MLFCVEVTIQQGKQLLLDNELLWILIYGEFLHICINLSPLDVAEFFKTLSHLLHAPLMLHASIFPVAW